MNVIEESVLKLDVKLRDVGFDRAFLGGSVLSLLVTDPMVDTVRVTKDVDVMMGVRTRKEFHALDATLERLGFTHDLREDAPICRWICDGITVDVLPIREEVLGWNSRWFEEALANAVPIMCQGHPVKVVSAPYFVALKLEAFEERGNRDFIASTDFEDVICLFNGRESIVHEIAECDSLKAKLAGRFTSYLQSPDLKDAIEGFVQTESNPELRFKQILDRFTAVAALS